MLPRFFVVYDSAFGIPKPFQLDSKMLIMKMNVSSFSVKQLISGTAPLKRDGHLGYTDILSILHFMLPNNFKEIEIKNLLIRKLLE